MVYEDLYRELKKDIPEGIKFYEEKEKENLIDERDGKHVDFGMVVVPYIFYIIQNGENSVVRKMFLFLEKMAVCNDIKIKEILKFTILEQIIDGKHDLLEQCKRYMGVQTLQYCEEIEKYFL